MPVGGGVRLSGGPVFTDNEASMLESDVSSVIDLSDHYVVSDTEDELRDTQKYRMPDAGKTRLHLRTKEPLSPTPLQADTDPRASPRRQRSTSTPPTPTMAESTAAGPSSSPKLDFSTNWANSSAENISDRDFVRPGISRANSVYTLGRASFTGQLSQLTSMQLPDADSLAKRMSSKPTAAAAAKALSDASDQIRMWISKASDVLSGLNAEDDVEWAAAGGREGIEEMDDAIGRFERLVQVYILSIERLQTRQDIAQLSSGDLNGVVKQMEAIVTSWKKIKDTLSDIKDQVEIAMEWEELWNKVLGEIAQEMEGLHRLVFEMEEKRHESTAGLFGNKDTIDLSELETIVEEHLGRGRPPVNNRLSLLPPFSPTPPAEKATDDNADDSSLLALFARMQPLRASLDFLPMRLSAFHNRGNPTFPTACLDLENRQDELEALWKKLESDAESLRRELGEDRWVIVFRNAGRQALKMCESITRSYMKVQQGIEVGEHQVNMVSLTKKVESFEAKKTHYGPAIERVLAIIDRGVLDRLTVNGEILRLQSDMKDRWTTLQAEMHELDNTVAEISSSDAQDKQLRDSVSTVMSSERSLGSSLVDTPGSSPASSIVGNSRKNSFQGSRTPTLLPTLKIRTTSTTRSRLPSASSSIPRRTPLATRVSSNTFSLTSSPAASSTPSKSSPAWPSRPEAQIPHKPRWTGKMKAENRDFRPLSAYEPSPYAKTPVTPKHNYLRSTIHVTPSALPAGARTTGARAVSTPTPMSMSATPRPSIPAATASTRKSSLPVPTTTPLAAAKHRPSPLNPKGSNPSLRPASRQAANGGRRSSMMHIAALPPALRVTDDGNEADTESPAHHNKRPPSALASGRRSSQMLHTMRSTGRLSMDRAGGGGGGGGGHGAAAGLEKERPKWRM